MSNSKIPSDMNFNFFKEATAGEVALLIHTAAVSLNNAAYKAIGEPIGLKVGVSEQDHVIYIFPVFEKGEPNTIYLSEYCLSVKTARLTTKRATREALLRLGLKSYNPGTYDGEKLIIKF